MRPLVVVGVNGGVVVNVAVSPSEAILSIFERKSAAIPPSFPGIRSPRNMKVMKAEIRIRIKTTIAISVHEEEVFWDLIVDVLENPRAWAGTGDGTWVWAGTGDGTWVP